MKEKRFNWITIQLGGVISFGNLSNSEEEIQLDCYRDNWEAQLVWKIYQILFAIHVLFFLINFLHCVRIKIHLLNFYQMPTHVLNSLINFSSFICMHISIYFIKSFLLSTMNVCVFFYLCFTAHSGNRSAMWLRAATGCYHLETESLIKIKSEIVVRKLKTAECLSFLAYLYIVIMNREEEKWWRERDTFFYTRWRCIEERETQRRK